MDRSPITGAGRSLIDIGMRVPGRQVISWLVFFGLAGHTAAVVAAATAGAVATPLVYAEVCADK